MDPAIQKLIDDYHASLKKDRHDMDVRCLNCKSKLRLIKHDFRHRRCCKTCYTAEPFIYENRKDIYKQNEEGKWVKNKIRRKSITGFYFYVINDKSQVQK